MSRLFLDTNVSLYAIDEDSRYYHQARGIVLGTADELFSSSKNISEFLAVVTRGRRVSLSIEDALTVLEDFASTFTILYPNPATYEVFTDLLRRYRPTGLKIHDFEIASIAISNGITQLVTFNPKDFEEIESLELVAIS